jgi:hypothetical protein
MRKRIAREMDLPVNDTVVDEPTVDWLLRQPAPMRRAIEHELKRRRRYRNERGSVQGTHGHQWALADADWPTASEGRAAGQHGRPNAGSRP